MTATPTFEHNDKDYEIRYTMKRIQSYESNYTPVMASIMQNNGAFSLSEMEGLIAYGLKLVDGGYISPRKGLEIAEDLIEEHGYVKMMEAIIDALERDCGFFFAISDEEIAG